VTVQVLFYLSFTSRLGLEDERSDGVGRDFKDRRWRITEPSIETITERHNIQDGKTVLNMLLPIWLMQVS
jgi:hypothetical protein